MFVGDEVFLEVSFAVACERLTQLTESGALITTSEDSYSRETGALARVAAIGLSKLVRVQVRELARTEKAAGIALRWEAVGPGGGLFPVLDADVRLTPADEHVTLLSMAGSYRPQLGTLGQVLDQAILHRVAAATIHGFVTQIAARIDGGQSGGAAETREPNGAGSSPPAGEGPL